MKNQIGIISILFAMLLSVSCAANNEKAVTPTAVPPSPSPSPTEAVLEYTPTPTVTLSKIRPETPELSDEQAAKAYFEIWDKYLPHTPCTADDFYEEYRKRKVNFDRYCLGYGHIGVSVEFAFDDQDSGDIGSEIEKCLEILSDIPYSDYLYLQDDKKMILSMSFEDYTYENLVRILKKENVRRLLIRNLGGAVDG